jgi:hypothetical protein
MIQKSYPTEFAGSIQNSKIIIGTSNNPIRTKILPFQTKVAPTASKTIGLKFGFQNWLTDAQWGENLFFDRIGLPTKVLSLRS